MLFFFLKNYDITLVLSWIGVGSLSTEFDFLSINEINTVRVPYRVHAELHRFS